MKPVRVLVLIDSLGAGGAERSLLASLPRLESGGEIDPVVFCLRRHPVGFEEEAARAGVRVHLLGGATRTDRIRRLRRRLKDGEADVVYTVLFEADLVGRMAALGTGVPVVTNLVNTAYDPVRLEDPNVRGGRLRIARLVDSWTARHLTTHFHAISRAVADTATRRMGIPAERITVIPRGRDPAEFPEPDEERRRVARDALGVPDGARVLLNVGRQEFQKGQLTMLRALSLLAGAGSDVVLLVAGRTGHASQELAGEAQRLALGDGIRLLGHRTDVPELLAAADVFVFPSLYEGLGGAVIEAMASALPVVVSDLPALGEVVEHGRSGLLVPPGDPTALAAALRELLDDPPRARAFGRRGREIFLARFTIDRIVRETRTMLLDVAATRGRRTDGSPRS